MPEFLMSVASPVFPNMKLKYKGVDHYQVATPQFNFPNLHMVGAKDPYVKHLISNELFYP